MTVMIETGWAKINLALHVRSRRADGYHAIETLFAFVDAGDRIEAEIADEDRLGIDGEFAGVVPPGPDNLVVRTLELLRAHHGAGRIPPLAISLTKTLPVAAGLGGGSADAAALARLVIANFLPEVSRLAAERLLAPLGADIAACIRSRTCLGTGTGEELEDASEIQLGGTPVLLVNPRLPLATGPVFAAWDGIDRGPLFTGSQGRAQLFAARNDLQRAAIAQCPAVADILTEVGALRPWLVRMSGSGATCFALFEATADRDAAARALASSRPGWWQLAGSLR